MNKTVFLLCGDHVANTGNRIGDGGMVNFNPFKFQMFAPKHFITC